MGQWERVGNIMGPPGSASLTRNVVGEVPSGSLDGANVAYATAQVFVAGTLAVFLNGVRLKASLDFTEVSAANGFTMAYAPLGGDLLFVDYVVEQAAGQPIYLGSAARLVPLPNGVQLEVKDSSGAWQVQVKYTEN